MRREKNTFYFTEEDKKSLCVRKYTDAEVKENVKRFQAKENTRRLGFALLLLTFIRVIRLFPDLKYLFVLCISFVIFLIIFYECIAKLNMRYHKLGYYIEFVILKKLKRETYEFNQLDSGGMSEYYPVIGQDTMTGYITKYYLYDWEENAVTKVGDRVRINVSSKEL